MNNIINFSDIFKNNINYSTINSYSDTKLRNNKNGVSLYDAIYYRFKYAEKNATKQQIISDINLINETSFSRQSYEFKENNISLKFYELILEEIKTFYNTYINSKNDILYSVDGTYNSNNNRTVMLNLGIFDVHNNIPVDIVYGSTNNRNNEVDMFIKYVKQNIDDLKNVIFVADRLYFNYKLINFLHTNNLKYIIRIKGTGKNLDVNTPLNKYLSNLNLIENIRKNIRIVKCKNSYKKRVNVSKSKRIIKEAEIEIKNDCFLVTNLINMEEYTDDILLDYYNSRWDIEVFFKLMKYNFKFQNMNEKNEIQYKKLYICELVIVYITKILENYYWKNNKKNNIIKKRNGNNVTCEENVNKSNIIKGLFNTLLRNIIYGDIDIQKLNSFCNTYIVTFKNELNRSFPRNSKTPFTKWYIKSYSEMTKYSKIIEAIKNKTVNQLNKNLKVIANKILSTKII